MVESLEATLWKHFTCMHVAMMVPYENIPSIAGHHVDFVHHPLKNVSLVLSVVSVELNQGTFLFAKIIEVISV